MVQILSERKYLHLHDLPQHLTKAVARHPAARYPLRAMKRNLWLTMVTCLVYCLDQELWKAIEYLKEQVKVLKEQQEKDKRILLDNHQRMRPAAKAKQLTRELLEQTTVLFTPETILSWYRRLIAQKYDGSQNCKNPGRPKISQEIIDLVIRFKQENPRWGYTRIRDYLVYLRHKIGETTVKNILLEHGYDPEPDLTRKTAWKEFLKSHWNVLAACDLFSIELFVKGKLVRYMVLFAIDVATRKVEILGVHAQPNGPWMEQIARNVSSEGGFLTGKKYLIHDRDSLYTDKFDSILKASGVEAVKLPPRGAVREVRPRGVSRSPYSLLRRTTAIRSVRIPPILSSREDSPRSPQDHRAAA